MSSEISDSIVRRILLFGDDFGLPQLINAVPNQLICGLVGAEIRSHQHASLQRLAKMHEWPLLIQPRASSPRYLAFVENVQNLVPDLILVNSYSMLVRPDVLAIPRFGGVNIHGALLPQYRGSNPTQWALLNDATQSGVTIHYMTAKFDEGNIIAQRRVPIYFEDTWLDIQARIAVATEAMLAEEIPKLLTQTNTRQPQDESKARYYKRRRPKDGLVDWQRSVLYIYNLVRALVKPHPGAFYYAGADKVVLDEYLSIPQITGLKYGWMDGWTDGRRGGQMLKSEHVVLTPLTPADLPLMFDWINDREQVLFNAPYKPISEGQHERWFEAIQQRNDVVIFGIRLLDTDKLIGSCQLHGLNWVHRSAELQIRIGEVSARRQGYGTQAVRLLLDFAFKDLNLHRVYLHVFSTNAAAIRVYEKVGFVREGLLRQAAHIDGEYIDVQVMGILREEYVKT